jgi:hypothetical protein
MHCATARREVGDFAIGNEGVMREMIWVPLAVAAIGTVLTFLVSLVGNKRRKDSAALSAAKNESVSCLRPKTRRDCNARNRLPHLRIQSGSYRLGEVRLALRQCDF